MVVIEGWLVYYSRFRSSNNGTKNNLRAFGGFYKGFLLLLCRLSSQTKVAAGRLSPPDSSTTWNIPFSAGSAMCSNLCCILHLFHIRHS